MILCNSSSCYSCRRIKFSVGLGLFLLCLASCDDPPGSRSASKVSTSGQSAGRDEQRGDRKAAVSFCGTSPPIATDEVYCDFRTEFDDLSVLEKFSQPERIRLAIAENVDLSPISAHKTLREIELKLPNVVTDLKPLVGMAKLESVKLVFEAPSIASVQGTLKTLADTKLLTSLEIINGKAITNASFLSAHGALTHLDLRFSEITSISFARQLPQLKVLNVAGTGVNDLTPLRDHKVLEALDLGNAGDGELVSLDGIENVTTLKFLDVGSFGEGPQLTDLTPIAALTSLEELDLESAKVDDLSSLTNLVNLKKLNLRRAAAAGDATPLADMVKLEHLNLMGTQIRDVTPLANMKNLKVLYLGDVSAGANSPRPRLDLQPLASLTKLEELTIVAATIPDTSPLKNISTLRTLNMVGATFESFPTASLPSSIRDMNLGYAVFPSKRLDALSDLTSLKNLDLSEVKPTPDLTSLAGLESLRDLNLRASGVTDTSPLKALIRNGLSVRGVTAKN